MIRLSSLLMIARVLLPFAGPPGGRVPAIATTRSCQFRGYLFARVDGRAVGRNIFLDGNTFSDSHSVDSNPFVADLSAGVAVNIKNTKLAYAFVYRTKEFKDQEDTQIFGTVSLNWTF